MDGWGAKGGGGDGAGDTDQIIWAWCDGTGCRGAGGLEVGIHLG